MTTIHKIAMGAKPDPFNFTVVKTEIVNGNTIVLAKYHGCKTFDGHKLMILKGEHQIEASLDPHFLDEEYAVRARFIPNEEGWNMARLCAGLLTRK